MIWEKRRSSMDVRVHLYNLYTDEAGNRELPQKFQTTAAQSAFPVEEKEAVVGGSSDRQ